MNATPQIYTTAQIRTILRTEFGSKHYQIRRDGNLHVYGEMPHGIGTDGWYYFGWLEDEWTQFKLADLAKWHGLY